MKIVITGQRAIVGQSITVSVETEGPALRGVTTTLDGSELEEFAAPPGCQQYERSFDQVGSGGPGQEHTVEVVAFDELGKEQSAVKRWTDAI